jgi:hypothetical protein
VTIELTPEPPDADADVILRALRGADPVAVEARSAWWRAGIHENVAPHDAAPDADAAPV